MAVSFVLSGLEEFSKLSYTNQAISKALELTWHQAGNHVRNDILTKMSKGTRDNPSQPGEYPHIVSGALAASIIHLPLGVYGFEIGGTTAYADFLEEGTAHMAARPYLQPSMEASLKVIETLLVRNTLASVSRGKLANSPKTYYPK